MPSLVLIDAIDGVEGNGPGRAGMPVKGLNLLICGTSALATDVVATKIMGIEPEKVKHLMLARQQGIDRFEDDIGGEDIDKVTYRFKLPSNYRRLYNIYYWLTDATCSGCADVIGEMKNIALKKPVYLVRLMMYGLLSRLDLVTGQWDRLPDNIGKNIICIGDCTAKIANKYDLKIANGCPPVPEEVLKLL
jgi:hypothetical protein